jgi:antitoxin YefM
LQVIRFTDARNSLKAVIDKVIDDQTHTLIYRREGGNVVVSEEAYSSIQETLYLLSSPANARSLMRSFEQLKSGKAKKRKKVSTR